MEKKLEFTFVCVCVHAYVLEQGLYIASDYIRCQLAINKQRKRKLSKGYRLMDVGTNLHTWVEKDSIMRLHLRRDINEVSHLVIQGNTSMKCNGKYKNLNNRSCLE